MIISEGWNLHPDHHWLRGKRPESPVAFDEATHFWNVYGYAEAVKVLADTATFSSDAGRLVEGYDSASQDGDLTQMDPPRHKQLRRLASHAFTPKVVADMEPRIAALTGELLDAAEARGSFDLVADLAMPMPVIVIADMLGLPKDDLDLLRAWTDTVIDPPVDFTAPVETEEQKAALAKAMADGKEFMATVIAYLREHAEDRRRSPREDLLTRLVQAEVDGERLDDTQLTNFVMLLFVAGHITTTMLVGNTILALDADRGSMARVRADRSLVPGAIEETLRVLSPVTVLPRVTDAAVELGGRLIERDRMVMVMVSAANRDPRQFADPDRFDVTRDPNPHIGFGRGAHFCLGAPLARLEGTIAVNVLLDRYPNLRTDPARPVSWKPNPAFTRAEEIHLLVD